MRTKLSMTPAALAIVALVACANHSSDDDLPVEASTLDASQIRFSLVVVDEQDTSRRVTVSLRTDDERRRIVELDGTERITVTTPRATLDATRTAATEYTAKIADQKDASLTVTFQHRGAPKTIDVDLPPFTITTPAEKAELPIGTALEVKFDGDANGTVVFRLDGKCVNTENSSPVFTVADRKPGAVTTKLVEANEKAPCDAMLNLRQWFERPLDGFAHGDNGMASRLYVDRMAPLLPLKITP